MFDLLVRCILLIGLRIAEVVCFLLTIPYYWTKPKRLPPITDNVLLIPACTLAAMIRNKEITSESVIKAYISRVKSVNPILNAVVEDRFELAIKEAIQVDKMISQTNKTAEDLEAEFPLLGLPLTVKESIGVEGMSFCAGQVIPGGRKAAKDADIVRFCKDAGAIPILVSNTPELCGNIESSNNVTGTTCNPYDTRRTSGGSSGGEGALLGSGASLIGLGSDLLGSIRLPASFCGVWGHKLTANIVSLDGHFPGSKDVALWNEIFVLGPLARYSGDLTLLLNVILKNPSLQLHKKVNIANVKFYYLYDIDTMLLHRVDNEIKGAVTKVISHMASHGCKIQAIQLEEVKHIFELAYTKPLSLKHVEVVYDEEASQNFFKYLRSNLMPLTKILGTATHFCNFLPKQTMPRLSEKLNELKRKFCEVLGEDGVLICPVFPESAFFHGQIFGKMWDVCYTGIFNSLGMPATSCPMGLNSKGLPLGIQVVAAPNNDRLTLAVAQEIEKAFGGWIPPKFCNTLKSSESKKYS